MRELSHLLENNARWSGRMEEADPGFFERLSRQQAPRFLWIGCADSRVPANQIVDLDPGELFVHRNVANLVVHSDLNCLAVMQFAVEVLRVEHVIVCGHYGCGGVEAALRGHPLGLIDNWLRHIQDTAQRHDAELAKIDDEVARCDRLCEWNVIEQAFNVGRTTIVGDAWGRGQSLTVHAWVYALRDGRLRDLGVAIDSHESLAETRERLAPLGQGPRSD